MKKISLYLFLILAGLAVGTFTALLMSGVLGKGSAANFSDVNVNGWVSDWSIGSPAADPYIRARVARHGLLGLAKEEAVYFTKSFDEDGVALSEHCDYSLTGKGQPALWWSITLYDNESRLPMNEDNALSIDATQIGDHRHWRAVISPTPPETGHWLSSKASTQFDLTLRLYRPEANVIKAPEETVNAPILKKLTCRAGS